MPNLNEVLLMVAAQLHLDGNELIRYALEDNLGGYDIDENKRLWPQGSIWGAEGQILYAITRALKPEVVVQVGGWVGCSASHFALACQANNKGRVISIDNSQGGVTHGAKIPNILREYIELVSANGEDWLALQPDNSIELIFEDAGHSRESVASISKAALQALVPGGVLINHDAAHDIAYVGGDWVDKTVTRGGMSVIIKVPPEIYSDVGKAVRDGLEDAGARFKPYRTDDSDCGVAISIKPGESASQPDKYSVKVMAQVVDESETDASPLVENQADSEFYDKRGQIEGFDSPMKTVHENYEPTEIVQPEKQKRTRRKRNTKGELE